MTAPKPSVGLEILRETGVLAHVWPELLEGRGGRSERVARVRRLPAQPRDRGRGAGRDVTLRLAALLHDVGKPRTAAPRPDGRGNTFYPHEQIGARWSPRCWRGCGCRTNGRDGRAPRAAPHVRGRPGRQDKTLRRFVRRIGPEHLAGCSRCAGGHRRVRACPSATTRTSGSRRGSRRCWRRGRRSRVRDLAISGDDVVAMFERKGLAPAGFRGDRRVGRGAPRAVRGGHRRPVSERGGLARRACGTLHRRAFLRVLK